MPPVADGTRGALAESEGGTKIDRTFALIFYGYKLCAISKILYEKSLKKRLMSEKRDVKGRQRF